ncbi:MAG: outer membrane protein assembly factor BamA [Deferrisomatales bacterium]
MSSVSGRVVLAVAAALFAAVAATGAEAPPGEGAGHEARPGAVLRFEGNRALGESALRRAAEAELDESRGELRAHHADDAAFQMELAYRHEGYAFAEVDYEYERREGRAHLTFRIREGPRVILQSVRIEGNRAFDGNTLRAFFGPERSLLAGGGRLFVESRARSAASEIRDFYYQSGYLEVEVEGPELAFSEDRSQVTATVRVAEGPRHTVRDVAFRGEVLAEAEGALKGAAAELVGQVYVPRRRLTLQSRVLEIYGDLGYPDVRAEVAVTPGPGPGDRLLAAEIASGPRVAVESVEVRGNDKTRSSFLRNRLALAPGDPYSQEKMRTSFRNLYRTGLFRRVDLGLEATGGPDDPHGAAEDREAAHADGVEGRTLVLDVEEAPSLELYLEPGWGSYEYLRFRAGLRERNLFGTGRSGRVEGGVSVFSRDALVGLTDPWFLRSQVTADLPVYYRWRREPSFDREEKGVGVTLSRPLTPTISAAASYDFRITSLTRTTTEETAFEDEDSGYALASLAVQASHDTRDDFFFPTRGGKTTLGTEAAETYLGSDITYLRFTGSSRWFASLTGRTVLGARYQGGLVLPTGSQVALPLGERFFNGGESTVRSFRESELGPADSGGDPLGGHGYNVLSLEVRQRLRGNLAGTLFWDYGNLSPNRSLKRRDAPYDSRSDVIADTLDDFFRDFRSGVGAGLQYLLPVGPARLDFAVNPSPRGREDRWVLHFSVGMAF